MGERLTGKRVRELLATRKIERVVVLGANGTMGYGSAALFTQAVPQVTPSVLVPVPVMVISAAV